MTVRGDSWCAPWMMLLLFCMALATAAPLPLRAESGGTPARLDLAASSIQAEGRDRGRPRPLQIDLALGHAVPYRVYFLDAPPRLVVDFHDVDFSAAQPERLRGAELVTALRWGRFRPGWSRLVAELPGPYALASAIQQRNGDADSGAVIRLRLKPVKDKDFITRRDALSALWDLPEAAVPAWQPRAVIGTDRPLRVAIDPGHGGIDPGAQVGPITESAVMLGFSLELAAVMEQAGIEVITTRAQDDFIALERRMTLARAGDADLLVSLHADALPEGQAAGAAIYIWDPAANDRAAAELAARHDRGDLLAGIDLSDADDEIVQALMGLVRVDTQSRSRNLAGMLMSEMALAGVDMHRRPVRGAAFSVLKSPDIPSVLIELGFLTDPTDRANLFDPDWRGRMARAITQGALAWAADEVARSGNLRK